MPVFKMIKIGAFNSLLALQGQAGSKLQATRGVQAAHGFLLPQSVNNQSMEVKEYLGEVMAQTCNHVIECTAFPVVHQSQCPVLPYTLNVGYTRIPSHMTDTH